jgi:hypothetical protein
LDRFGSEKTVFLPAAIQYNKALIALSIALSLDRLCAVSKKDCTDVREVFCSFACRLPAPLDFHAWYAPEEPSEQGYLLHCRISLGDFNGGWGERGGGSGDRAPQERSASRLPSRSAAARDRSELILQAGCHTTSSFMLKAPSIKGLS